MLNAIRIVLVGTSHPGNIGSAARALKTMGMSQLYLVNPLLFPHQKATELASGATDVLNQAVLVPTLEEAIADCQLIVGTSARLRAIPWPMLSPREFAEKAHRAPNTQIAVVFGREQSGLTNEELHLCHYHIHIPSNEAYSSLNIASAVQIIAYELKVASSTASIQEAREYPLASAAAMAGFYAHLERASIKTGFLDPNVPRQLMTRMKRLFLRAQLDEMEVNILRGFLKAVEKNTL